MCRDSFFLCRDSVPVHGLDTLFFRLFFFFDAFKVLKSIRGDQYHALLRKDPLILAGLLGKLLCVRLLVDAV